MIIARSKLLLNLEHLPTAGLEEIRHKRLLRQDGPTTSKLLEMIITNIYAAEQCPTCYICRLCHNRESRTFAFVSIYQLKSNLQTWILIPIAYFGNIWGSPTYDIMSNKLFTKNGTSYPFQTLSESLLKLLQANFSRRLNVTIASGDSTANILTVYTDSSGSQQVNETRYDEVGLSYAGAQFTWGIFMVCYSAHPPSFESPYLFYDEFSGMPRTSRHMCGPRCFLHRSFGNCGRTGKI